MTGKSLCAKASRDMKAKVNGQADIWQYNDYYPFGSIPQNGVADYRYDYQGLYTEKDSVAGFNKWSAIKVKERLTLS